MVAVLPGYLTACSGGEPALAQPAAERTGKAVYEFYCYQCHGYDGTARTRAASSVDPAPRDFQASDPDELTRPEMIGAVRHGRAGTAMASFDSVLSDAEIQAVVEYVRRRFMGDSGVERRYHTAANGWPDHRARYGAAFPFVTGEIPLDTPPARLTRRQRRGLEMYFDGCVTCHDQPPGSGEGRSLWDPRPVSYPRGGYSHRAPDAVSSASFYVQRESHGAGGADELSAAGVAGRALYRQNCRFCHGDNGRGRNWIGTFLEPKAGDLPRAVANRPADRLRRLVQDGIEGTAMPAWRHVLTREEIDQVVTYLQEAFASRGRD